MLRLSALALSLVLASFALATSNGSTIPLGTNGITAGGVDFSAPQLYQTQGSHARSLVLFDVNGDGILDAIVLNGCNVGDPCSSANVSVRLGRADGSFGGASLYDANAYTSYALTVADINGDGHPDVIVSDSCVTPACTDPGTLSILFGNGDGTFQPGVFAGSGGDEPFALAVADVNGDSKPDLLVINYCQGSCGANTGNAVGELTVLLSKGDGSFQPPVSYSAGGNSPQAFVLADVNKDGVLDAVIANCGVVSDCSVGGVAVLLGNADGSFRAAENYASGGASSGSVQVSDLNGDGVPDLAVLHPCTVHYSDCSQSVIGILVGSGNGAFSAPTMVRTGTRIAGVLKVADLNDDGAPDLVVGASCDVSSEICSESVVSVLLANGSGNFRSPMTFASGGTYPRALAIADLNGDQKLDLVALNECDPSSLRCASGSIAVLTNSTVPAGTAMSFTSVSSAAQETAFGQPATFIAAVSGTSGVPTGSVGFSADGVLIQYVPLEDGVASFTTSNLVVGRHNLTAQYSGDPIFAPSSGETAHLVQGGIASLSATSLAFGTQPVGSSSLSLTSTLTNTGTLPLTLSSITISPASSGFTSTTTCPTSVSAGGSCKVGVVFHPTAPGLSEASLLIRDDAADPEQSIALRGTTAFVTSPNTLSFAAQYVSTTSRAQRVIITNSGTTTVPISAITVSIPDFVVQSGCGASLAAGASCGIDVAFHPTASGSRAGVIRVSSGSSSSQVIDVRGAGSDFSMASDGPSSLSVAAGKSAAFTFALRSAGIAGNVTFACTGTPARTTCSVSPNSLVLDQGSVAPFVVTVATTGDSASFAAPHFTSFAVLVFCGLPGIWLLPARRRTMRRLSALLLLVLLAVTCSCGGGAATATAPAGGNTGGTGTPSGTYQITVTGTLSDGSNTLSHSALVTLVVN